MKPTTFVLAILITFCTICAIISKHDRDKAQLTSQLQLELAIAKTENRVLAQKLAACQTVEREPKPILNF